MVCSQMARGVHSQLCLLLSIAFINSWGIGCGKVESFDANNELRERAIVAARKNQPEVALKNAERLAK